jgi:hypothetical protein
MTHDVVDTSMFWVGALFAFTPILLGGGALLIWWLWRRGERGRGKGERGPASTGF